MSDSTKFSLYDNLLYLRYTELKQMCSHFYSGGWKLSKEKHGVKLYTKTDEETGVKMIRGEGIVNAPASKILETALNVEENKIWDDSLEDRKLVEKKHTQHLIHNMMKRVGFLQKREALTIFDSFSEPDGTIYGIATSVDHPAVPASNEYVRAQVKMAGWILKPLQENPNKTFVTYVLNADPQGWVPKHLVNLMIEEQGMNVKKLGDFVEKKFSEVRA